MPRPGGAPENMIPAKKGEVRNPKGQKPGKQIKTKIRECLDAIRKGKDPVTGKITDLDTEYVMILKQIDKAIKKQDTRAFEVIMDRLYGRATQTIDANVTDATKTIKKLFPTKNELEESN